MLQTNKKVKKRKKIKFVRFHQLDQDSTNNNHFLSFDYFDVRFETKGPLGVWFTPSKYPPTIDRSQGKRTRLRLVAGDTLIAVNNELIIDVVKTEKLSDVLFVPNLGGIKD